MALVLTPYTYTDGNTLVADSHNRNIFSVGAGEGLLSEPNGGIDQNNLSAGFKISDDSVQAEELMVARQEASLESLDFIDNAFSDTNKTVGIPSEDQWTPIPGLGIRFPVWFNSVSLIQWSVFVAPNRFHMYDAGNIDETFIIMIMCYVDGSPVRNSKRYMPITVTNVGFSPAVVTSKERRACISIDYAHLENFTKGMHDVSVRLFMERSTTTNFQITHTVNGTGRDDSYMIYNKFTVGIRNIRVLNMLQV